MSAPRGKGHQQRCWKAARQLLVAAGWQCRLDFSKSGGTQQIIARSPSGGEHCIQLHGTPRDEDEAMKRLLTRTKKLIRMKS